MRIGIATITSTALVGGTLVAVPAHPLLPITAVAQAQEAVASQPLTAADIATARALGIDLDLLNLAVLDAIEAEDAWPNSSDAENDALTLEALQALRLDLGGRLNDLPLIKGGSGAGLLDLGGQGVGLLGASADAPGVSGITASAGVLAESGSIGLDPNLNTGTGPAKVDVLALTSQLGLDPVVSALVQELNLEIGAIGSEIEKNGDTYTSNYTVADLNLVLESTAVAELAAALNGVGLTLDTTLDGVLGDAGVVTSITDALGPLTTTLGLGTPEVTLDTNLQGTVQALIGGVIYDGQSAGGTVEDALVELNLNDGTIKVNLENLHDEGLNNRPANTPLTTTEVSLITDTVNGLVQELLGRVEAALQNGISDTAVKVSIGVDTKDGSSSVLEDLLEALGGLDLLEIIAILTGGLVGGIEINSTLGGLLGTPDYAAPSIESTGDGLLMEILAPLLDGILGDVVSPLGASLQTLLFSEVDRVLDAVLAAGPANEVLGSLAPLLDTVLQDVLLITLNKQDDGLVGEYPSRTVTALDVQLLPGLLTSPTASLSLAASQVSGPTTADLDAFAPAITVIPEEGPFGEPEGEPETVTIAGENLVYVDGAGTPVSLVTGLTFGAEVVPAADITANADGSLTVKVPVVTADAGETSRLVDVTLTTGGGEDTDEFTYRQADSDADTYAVTYQDVEVGAGETATSTPAFTADGAAVVVPEGASFDLGADAPEWATIDEVTGVVTFAPGEDVAVSSDPVPVPVVVTYSDDSVDEAIIAVTVTEADVTPTPDLEADVYEVVYSDVEVGAGETATSTPAFTADGAAAGVPEGASFDLGADAPEWATIDEVTGVVTFAPGEDVAVSSDPVPVPVVVTYSDDSVDEAIIAVTVTEADVTPQPDPAPSLDGTPKPVDPTDESQDTGLNIENGDESDVVAKDENGNNLVVEVDVDGNISVIPGDIVGPITIIVNENDADNRDEREVPVNAVPGVTPPASGGSENGSSEFLQQCLNSPAAGVAGLLVVLGAVGAIGGPALEPMFKAIGGELDRQLRMMVNVTAGAHQPVWVRNINKGLNDAANAVDHRMVTNALFATAALALASSPILCGMDNSSSGSSESN